jgi:hypothetical protein
MATCAGYSFTPALTRLLIVSNREMAAGHSNGGPGFPFGVGLLGLGRTLGAVLGKGIRHFPTYDFHPPAEYQLQRALFVDASGSFSPVR